MVAGQAFMELALTPRDVRDIIGRGHLAVVLGVELDSVGNFCSPNKTDNTAAPFNSNPTDAEIQAELERLYSEGVRYFFPIHLTDNAFGGAALYEMAFDTANRFEFGQFYMADSAPQSSEIGFKLDPPTDYWGLLWKLNFEGIAARFVEEQRFGFDPESYPPAPYTTTGHRNSRGLQDQGRVALDALMRLGAMIDVDHMGEKTVEQTLQHTAPAGYPVFAGHNTVRRAGGSERAHIARVAGEIMDRGGMWGSGIKDGTESLHSTISQLRKLSPNGGIAVGSDCSGMELLPAERPTPPSWPNAPTIRDYEAAGFVVYRDLTGAPPNALERCKFGNREYDIDFDGFAHIGMYPDFLEDGVSSGHLNEGDLLELFRAPEAFVQAWEKCLAVAAGRGPAAAADLSYLVPLLLED